MAITRLYKCKDFEIKWYLNGSRLADKPHGLYTVIYHGEDGKGYHNMDCAFSTVADARRFISAKVKKANAVLKKAHAEGRIHLNSLR